MSALVPRSCALLLLSFAVLSGCKDTGVVGTNPGCAKVCPKDELCHPARFICVECAKDNDCTAKDHGSKPYCDAQKFSCGDCRDPTDCSTDKPYCVQGECKDSAGDDHGGTTPSSNRATADAGTSRGSAGTGHE